MFMTMKMTKNENHEFYDFGCRFDFSIARRDKNATKLVKRILSQHLMRIKMLKKFQRNIIKHALQGTIANDVNASQCIK